MKRILFAILILIPIISFANIYQWQDEQGNVHFSNEPQPGAVVADIPAPQTYKPRPRKQFTIEPYHKTIDVKEVIDTIDSHPHIYTAVSIVQPQNEGTIWNTAGNLEVKVEAKPALKKGDKIIVYIDGKETGEPQKEVEFVIPGIERGTHTLQVTIEDAKGRVLIRSNTVTFYIHQTFISSGLKRR